MITSLPADFRTRNVIEDGYTRVGYIAPFADDDDPRVQPHSGLLFLYRPMLPEVVAAITDDREKSGRAAEARSIAAAAADHLRDWSEEDEHGQKKPINQNSYARLPYDLFWRVYHVISGNIKSDALPASLGGPEGSKPGQSEYEKQKNRQHGQTELAVDQGNSAEG